MGILDKLREFNIELPEHRSDWTNQDVVLDKRLATILLEECSFSRQRIIKRATIEQYKREYRRGEFASKTFMRLAIWNDRGYLINGRHRCTFIWEEDGRLNVKLDVVRVNTEKELNDLYAYEDAQKQRNSVDQIRAYGLLDTYGVNETESKAIGAAVRCITHRYENKVIDRAASLYIKGIDIWVVPGKDFYSGLCKTGVREILNRAPVLAVVLQTFRYQPEKAREFWYGLAEDEGLMKGDPRKTLLNFLRSTRVRSLGSGKNYAALAITAWNAFYAGKPLERFGSYNPTNPNLYIAGTPFKNERDALNAHRIEIYGATVGDFKTKDKDKKRVSSRFLKNAAPLEVASTPIPTQTTGIMPW